MQRTDEYDWLVFWEIQEEMFKTLYLNGKTVYFGEQPVTLLVTSRELTFEETKRVVSKTWKPPKSKNKCKLGGIVTHNHENPGTEIKWDWSAQRKTQRTPLLPQPRNGDPVTHAPRKTKTGAERRADVFGVGPSSMYTPKGEREGSPIE